MTVQKFVTINKERTDGVGIVSKYILEDPAFPWKYSTDYNRMQYITALKGQLGYGAIQDFFTEFKSMRFEN